MSNRVHISNAQDGVLFSDPGVGRGRDGDVKKGSWFGKSITLEGKDAEGLICKKKVNTGSLIDLINIRLPKNQRLKKGCFFGLIGRSSNKKVLEAFYREFPLNIKTKEITPLCSFQNKNNIKVDLFAVKNDSNFDIDTEVFLKAYPGFGSRKLKFFENGLEYLKYFFNKQVAENIQNQKGYYVRAHAGDKLAGCVYYDLNWNKDKPIGEKSLYVDQIFIDPEFQKSGIGKELLFSIFKDKELASGFNSIVVLVETYADNARAFYEKLGFKPVDQDLIPFCVRGGSLYRWTSEAT